MLEMSIKLLNLNSISLCSSCCCMHWDCRTKIFNAYYWIFHAFNLVSFVLSVLGRWILKCGCLYFCMFLIGYHYSIIRYPFYLVNTNVIESIYLILVSPHHCSFGIFFSGHVFSIVSFQYIFVLNINSFVIQVRCLLISDAHFFLVMCLIIVFLFLH